jgi:hypothetical protein
LQFECARDGIRNYRETDSLEIWRLSPVIRIPFDDDFFVLLLRDETIRAAADQMTAEVASTADGDDADRAVREAR